MTSNVGRITSRIWIAAIFVFLYLPILTLVVLVQPLGQTQWSKPAA